MQGIKVKCAPKTSFNGHQTLSPGAKWPQREAEIIFSVKIRNTIIQQKMKVTRSLLEDIKTKQLQWYGHVQRMEEGRLPKEVMKWRPPGRT
jgi:hypothetical protein